MSGGDGEPRGGALGRRACGGAHLAAEHAHELLVLADLHLLHLLTQRGTVPGAVLARDSHLLRVLALRCCSGARSEQWRATRSACPERRVFAEVRVRLDTMASGHEASEGSGRHAGAWARAAHHGEDEVYEGKLIEAGR